MSSKLLLTFQVSFQHTHLVTLWFRISWWCLLSPWCDIRGFVSPQQSFFLLVSQPHQAACISPGGLPSHFPFCLGRWLSVCPLLGDPSPSLWPPGLSSVAFPGQHYHKDCPQKVRGPAVSCSLLFDQSLAEFHKVCTEEDSFIIVRGIISSTDLEPEWSRSNPSSTTSSLILARYLLLEASAFSSVKLAK